MSNSDHNTKPVIDDVARLAGVSVATVSRVVNGTARVSDDKVTRVRAAILELGFRPSAAGRALVGRKPRIIAVMAGDAARFEHAETIRGIEEKARAAGYLMSLTVVEDTLHYSADYAVSLILDQSIAGVIVLLLDPQGVAGLRCLPNDIPIVAISGGCDLAVPQIVLNETGAAEELVTYLLNLGHTNVHYVSAPPQQHEDERAEGWRRALRTAGVVPPEIIHARGDPASGREIGRQLAHVDGVTAIFCGNDILAMGVISGLAEGGRSVPGEVSVVGFNDHPLAAIWLPPLTTVNQSFADLGSRACELLHELIAGENVEAVTCAAHPKVIIRDSAAAPRRPPRP